jgi:hypothetical protein
LNPKIPGRIFGYEKKSVSRLKTKSHELPSEAMAKKVDPRAQCPLLDREKIFNPNNSTPLNREKKARFFGHFGRRPKRPPNSLTKPTVKPMISPPPPGQTLGRLGP